ncbi:alkaline phosphatase [Candidatus Thorarchaeota archaeon]|nr:MAG: alkaline phosphatase [Candidatus Thorarchaeota archaeon]
MDFKGLGTILVLVLAIGCSGPIVYPAHNGTAIASENPSNIILMIGDGMGFNYTDLARLVEYGTTRNLTMMQLPTQLSSETLNVDGEITDSAAAGTAIATGEKTKNRMISIAPNGTILPTILEMAQSIGKATGVVSTSYIQHATPASFMSHVDNRGDYAEITRQIVESSDVDVLLGGGYSFFSDSQILSMQQKGYSILRNRTSLLEVNAIPILGLFADGHMDNEQARDLETIPSLAEMTNKSIQLLSRDQDGFFLMVEGSQIDFAGHDNDKVDGALETIAFDAAVKVALDFVTTQDNTLLIVTADHETGGLSVHGNTLSEELPSDVSGAGEKRNLRIERANNVTVSWSSDYHTASPVPIFGLGPEFSIFQNDTTIDNTKLFSEMRLFFGTESYEYCSETTETSETEETTDADTGTTTPPPVQFPTTTLWALAILIPIPIIIIIFLLRRRYS